MGALSRLTRLALGLTMPRNRWITRGPKETRAIALTFDDGPHPDLTPRLLDILGDLNVLATFFVVGKAALAAPRLIERIVREGHNVANHTWFHSEPGKLSTRALMSEVRETRALIRDLTSRDSTQFRPPKGEFTISKLRALWRAEQSVVMWSVDPKDFAMSSEAEAARWANQYIPSSGDIVLMHDNHPWCLSMVPTIVERVRDAELSFAKTADWTAPALCQQRHVQHATLPRQEVLT